MEPLSPRGAAQATSSSSSDEREAKRRPIRVVVDTSFDDSEIVEQNEIQDHVPPKHRTPRKSARRVRAQGCKSMATRRGTIVSKCRHPLSSSFVSGSRSLPSSPSRGHHRPVVIIRHGEVPRLCSTDRHGAATSSFGSGIGGTASSAGGALGGLPPSSTSSGSRATSSSVSSCDKVSGAPSKKKRHFD
jgi:hypothetical protein